MLRHARRLGRSDLVRLVVSVRGPDDLYYADEVAGPETSILFTRVTPPGFARAPGHLTAADIPGPITPGTTAFICGSSGFADAASEVLIGAGVPTADIRVERFGPSA